MEQVQMVGLGKEILSDVHVLIRYWFIYIKHIFGQNCVIKCVSFVVVPP